MSFNLHAYQAWTERTAIYPDASTGSTTAVTYAVLGLGSEAGEVGGRLSKIMRDDQEGWDMWEAGASIAAEHRAALLAELGDVMYFAARVATELDASLSDVLRLNYDKLESRKARNTLGGSGDER